MSSSHDLKEALSQRLKRLESGTNPSTAASSMRPGFSRAGSFAGNTGSLLNHNEFGKLSSISRLGSGLEGRSPQLQVRPSFLHTADVSAVAPAIECEGYLSKYSSGSLTARWQRRYFVLRGGRFGYFKKQPASSEMKADKTFSLRKIKAVFTKEPCGPSDREFSMELGDHVYQLKASTPSEMRRWMSVLSTAVAQKDSFPVFDDDDKESSGGDMLSVSNSVVSSVVSEISMSEDVQSYLSHQRALAAESAAHSETVWEIEVDVDQLDSLFSTLFPSANDQVQMSISEINHTVVVGVSKIVSHLYAVLANEVFDPDMIDLPGQFDRVKLAVESIRKSYRKHNAKTDEKAQLVSVLMEYIPRIVQVVDTFLLKRAARRSVADEDDSEEDSGSSVKDLPAIMAVVGTLISDIGILWQEQCGCVYCDAAGVAGQISDTCIVTDKWRKALQGLQQRVSSEFEVCLIESIQSEMLETAWDMDVKKITHPLLGKNPCWLSSWTPKLLVACQEKALNLLNNAAPTFPKRLVSELLASVLVAVLNSAWRQIHCKSIRTNAFVSERKKLIVKAANLLYANSGFWGVFTVGQTNLQITKMMELPKDEKFTLEFPTLVSFANEAILLSIFSAESLYEQLPFVPKIFAACFEGLAITFINAAIDTCNHIVYFHFVDKKIGSAEMFFSKRIETPMLSCRDLADTFVAELVPFGAHPSVRNHCINLLPAAIVHIYVSSLIKGRPRVKTGLPDILQKDLVVFKGLGGSESIVSSAMHALHWILSFLTETDIRILVDDLAPKLAIFFGPLHAHIAISVLIDMRGTDLSKQDKAAIMIRVDGAKNDSVDNLPWRFN